MFRLAVSRLPAHLRSRSICAPASAEASVSAEGSKPCGSDVDDLYATVLSEVPTHGFTPQAITAAVHALGWSPAAARMFPRGPLDVVDRLVATSNRTLAAVLAEKEMSDDPVERFAFAARTRLQMMDKFHPHWSKALALHHSPTNAGNAARQAAMLVDEMAHFAGYSNPDVRFCMVWTSSSHLSA
ncbi:unnamed protein product [Chondrus crispus]|uniref:Ubiquinone biosynthesis protein n=1 Tax=Chondrus crispus TaxID=2769 RepID=S0F2W8_CHOCR|nr:unnamed protein product [Chondrus crispus]CDF77465.1 unnamed protein product [Chondrus crispus]|eukprot:XP_005712339.1 unnamed protein product [Chondrus crispus]